MNTKAGRVFRIGILSPVSEPGMRSWWRQLTEGLKELGYVEGSNIAFVWRYADGRFENLPSLATELAGLEVDVLMPATPPAIRAAKSASDRIPIVFPLGSDPVETGLVESFERPGGNITGMATMSWKQSRLRLALVREMLPQTRCVALIRHSANAALELQVQESRSAARELDLEVLVLNFSDADDIARTFEAASDKGAEVLLPLSDPLALANATLIGELSMRYRLPVVSPFAEITEVGGVLSYGPNLSTLFRRSASMVDQILKGTNPGDIPIGEPQDFELSINLLSSDALNLTIPASLRSRATRAIQ